MTKPIQILFVCTANVCRSPMAAGFMAANAQDLHLQLRVASASVDHEVRSIHPTAHAILAERGIELGRSLRQPITRELVSGADLILAMTAEHVRRIVGRFPEARAKVFALAHLAAIASARYPGQSASDWLKAHRGLARDYAHSQRWDIQDPISEPEDAFRRVGEQIDQATLWLAGLIVEPKGDLD